MGYSGLTVSVLGLGCNNFGLTCSAQESRALVDAALDAGITLFDTAQAYGNPRGSSETFLGEALQGRRHTAILSTKVGSFSLRTPGVAPASRRGIRAALETSLRRLQTDYVDLLYLHQPDDSTPIEETLATMSDLVHEGKVRYIASANLSAWRVVEAHLVAQHRGYEPFIAAQNAYSLVDRMVELDLAVVCARYGIGLAPYFPLANGLLTGRYRRGEPPPPGSRLATRRQVLEDERALDHLEALEVFAAERGLSLLAGGARRSGGQTGGCVGDCRSQSAGPRLRECLRQRLGALGRRRDRPRRHRATPEIHPARQSHRAPPRRMKIAAIECLAADAGWRIHDFLKLTLDDGRVGWSEFSRAFAGPGVIATIETVAEQLIGRDPQSTRSSTFLREAGRQSTLGYQAASAISNALLDVRARALSVPVWQLLGPRLRDEVAVYWAHCGTYRVSHAESDGETAHASAFGPG